MSHSSTSIDAVQQTSSPSSLWELFLGFSWLAVQGFGAAAPVAYRELVERKRWLTAQDFAQDWAVAQLMPGPNAINLSLMVGDRYFGGKGAFVSLMGMTSMPMIIAVTLATIYNQFSDVPEVAAALHAMGAVAAGLIMGTALKLLTTIDRDVFGRGVTLGVALFTFVAVAILKWPLIAVLAVMCVLATWWAHRQIVRIQTAQRGQP